MPTKQEIEEEVRQIHQKLWRQTKTGELPAADHIALLDPVNIAKVLGVSLEYVHQIRDTRYGFHTTGLLLRDENRIVVSTEYPIEEVRFTAAHELGHLVLHKQQRLFRDRPIRHYDANPHSRPAIEAEADYFAACLLMPANLLRRRFEETFGIKVPYIFDESWAFHLSPNDTDSLLIDGDFEVNRAFALAKARSFNNRYFHPLHSQFQVSIKAMAYRLQELGLAGSGRLADVPPKQKTGKTASPLFPPGFHHIQEHDLEDLFANRFSSPTRRAELVSSLRAFIAFVRQIGITCELWIDGSLATDKPAPTDVDLAVFIYPGQIDRLTDEQYAELELLGDHALMEERYACDVHVEPADDQVRRDYFAEVFGYHYGVPKGIPVLRVHD